MVKMQIDGIVSNNFFESFMTPLVEYFKDKKEYRTLRDVDNAFKFLVEKGYFKSTKSLDAEELKEEFDIVKESVEGYLENNSDKITATFKNLKARGLMTYWITNFDMAMNVLFASMDAIKNQRRAVILWQRQTTVTKNLLGERFLNITKAIFLVLFRIVEQIILISKDEPLDIDKEIEYLVNDLVYLKNIQRKNKLLHN